MLASIKVFRTLKVNAVIGVIPYLYTERPGHLTLVAVIFPHDNQLEKDAESNPNYADEESSTSPRQQQLRSLGNPSAAIARSTIAVVDS